MVSKFRASSQFVYDDTEGGERRETRGGGVSASSWNIWLPSKILWMHPVKNLLGAKSSMAWIFSLMVVIEGTFRIDDNYFYIFYIHSHSSLSLMINPSCMKISISVYMWKNSLNRRTQKAGAWSLQNRVLTHTD